MTNVRVRLYEGVDGEGSLVGVSQALEGLDLTNDSALNRHLAQYGQTIEKIDTPRHLEHLRGEYYRVQPPLEERQIRRFAQLCLHIADTGYNAAFFIDNRQTIPERPLQTAGNLLDWIG